MALQGTLDTFALADVLRLLASTHKSGRLVLDGDRGTGSVWFGDGQLIGGETPSTARSDELHTVVFQMLRFSEGHFRFEADQIPDSLHAPADVDDVISEAEALLAEWLDIESVVPSMRSWLTLAPELDRDPEDSIKIKPAAWRLIASIGAGSTAAMLGERTELEDLELCRAVKALVETGLVAVGDEVGDSVDLADRSYALEDLDLPDDLLGDRESDTDAGFGIDLGDAYGAPFSTGDADDPEAEHDGFVLGHDDWDQITQDGPDAMTGDDEPDYFNDGDTSQTARRRLDVLTATIVGEDEASTALGQSDDQSRPPLPEPLPEGVESHSLAPIDDSALVVTDHFEGADPLAAEPAPDLAPEGHDDLSPTDSEPVSNVPEGWDTETGQWADTANSSWDLPAEQAVEEEPEAARSISGLSPKAAEAIAAAASSLGPNDEPVLPGRSRLRRNVTSRR